MTPELLKASILQYAMQGKITEQLEEDGNASDILPLLNINKKVVANEPPFDIPENWLWIPIGNLGASTDTESFADGPFGSNLKTVHYINEPEVRIIQLSNIGEYGWKDKNIKYTSNTHLDEVIPRCEVHPGDLVIAKMMPAGRTIEVPNLGTRITLGSDAMKFVPNPALDKKFLLWAMHSQAFLEQVYAEAHGITRVRTTLNGVKSYVLPIPPLKEQKRIVAKIEELLSFVDRYAEAYEKLEKFNAKFPEDMKKSILQYAIMGKLVEQRAEEGTAEELYQQIQEEKQKLIAEKKIKKEKSLAEITEDEIPFDIPESWKWVRTGSIFSVGTGMTPLKGESKFYEGGTIPWITSTMTSNRFIDKAEVYITDYALESTSLSVYKTHTLLVAMYGQGKTRGQVSELLIPATINQACAALENILDEIVLTRYVYFFYLYNYEILRKKAEGTSQPNLNVGKISSTLIPLPPLEEQKRIVDKIEELLPYCDQLVK